MPVAIHAIGEPGNKTRVITKPLAALGVFLRPFARTFKEILAFDPCLKAGLGAGWQGYDLCQDLAQREFAPLDDSLVMTGDYVAATDHIEHQPALRLAHIAFGAMGIPFGSDSGAEYTMICLSMLCSPRRVVSYADRLTVRGVLMGDPGSKVI